MADNLCPQCGESMREVTTDHGSARRCEGCAGLWIDMGSHDSLKAVADTVDLSDAAGRSEQANGAQRRFQCPGCGGQMLRMVDPHQPHIHFESCSICQGRYYDAGEFTDLSRHTLSDVFKRLFARERA